MCRVYSLIYDINKQIKEKIKNTVSRYEAIKELLGVEYIVPVFYDDNKLICEVKEPDGNLKELKSSIRIRWNIEKPLLTPKIDVKLDFYIKYMYIDNYSDQKIIIFLEYTLLYGNFKASYDFHVEEIKTSTDNTNKEIEKTLSNIFRFIERAIEESFKKALKTKKVVDIAENNLIRKFNDIFEVPIDKQNVTISFKRINYYNENDFNVRGTVKIRISPKIKLFVEFNYTKYSKNHDKLEIDQILIEGDEEEMNNLLKQFLIYSFVENAFSDS